MASAEGTKEQSNQSDGLEQIRLLSLGPDYFLIDDNGPGHHFNFNSFTVLEALLYLVMYPEILDSCDCPHKYCHERKQLRHVLVQFNWA